MKEINVYSDESRHRGKRFLLLGGLWVRANDVAAIEQEIKKLRHKYGYRNGEGKFIDFLGELKWTKVSTKYLPIYKELADLFFHLLEQGKIRFCAMLVDTHDPAVQEYDNIKKDGYFKLLYQLYLHNCRVPDPVSLQKSIQGLLRTPVAGNSAQFLDDESAQVGAVGFEIFGIDAVVTDEGIGHHYHLSAIGRIGEHFLIAGHAGVENNFAFHLPGGAE